MCSLCCNIIIIQILSVYVHKSQKYSVHAGFFSLQVDYEPALHNENSVRSNSIGLNTQKGHMIGLIQM